MILYTADTNLAKIKYYVKLVTNKENKDKIDKFYDSLITLN